MKSIEVGVVLMTVSVLVAGASTIAPATRPAFPAVKDLPIIRQMPDPLTFSDGRKVTTAEQWKQRREEMKAIMEEYEYGHMPPPPGNVKGRQIVAARPVTVGGARGGAMFGMGGAATPTAGTAASYRMIRLSFGPEEKLGFDLGIFVPAPPTGNPAEPPKPVPVLINLGFGAGENSAASCAPALARGYGVVSIPYQQLGADSPTYRSTGFFPAYPEYDWNDFSAWAWGISRAVDYLVTDPAVDKEKIMATGVSRTGQAVLLAGAFDERIALVAPVGGGMALRFSGKDRGGGQGIDEVVDQNTYWFGPRFAEFKGQTDKLPCDQHWLPALTAPRAFILCNALADQYGNANAAAQTYLAAKPVYEFLKVPEKLGVNFRPGGHGMMAADWDAILDFADWHLRGIEPRRKFDTLPPAPPRP